MSNGHVFVRRVPSPQYCLMPNEVNYSDDKRIGKLKKILCNESIDICIIGVME